MKRYIGEIQMAEEKGRKKKVMATNMVVFGVDFVERSMHNRLNRVESIQDRL
jgi:hypothetical protein